jgi:benzoyl-CoA-dihydrodiol lyase
MPDPGLITFERHPASYQHWRLQVDGEVATVTMAVDPSAALGGDYELKLNTYDLGVDIELADIVQRLRFEHPAVRVVVLTSGLDKVFCAGANIQMLAKSSHHHKVNFCKFTNETRLAIEDATGASDQVWLGAVNGTAAGGGYELALACEEIILIDDRASAVSLPEVPLLGVLPGTGGLTRLVDKRHVRRDLADVVATRAEGVQGRQAVDWGLVDSTATRSDFAGHVAARVAARLAASTGSGTRGGRGGTGISLAPLVRHDSAAAIEYSTVEVGYRSELGAAIVTVRGPAGVQPASTDEIEAAGPAWWPLVACRELDDAILHLRFNQPELGTWVLATEGEPAALLDVEATMAEHAGHWLVREVRAYWKRTLKRLDASARSLVALIEPGSCFAGTLAELALAADRSLMLDGQLLDGQQDDDGAPRPPPALILTGVNDGPLPMANGLSRLATRFWGHPERLDAVRAALGKELLAADSLDLGLVTFAPDDLDWDDEVRLTLEERAAFSPDALTGMEASLRFAGPETTETKIFGRLSAWQNWIFLRPNATGVEGALRRFGTGSRPVYDRGRV